MTPEDKDIIKLLDKLSNTRRHLFNYYVKIPHIPAGHSNNHLMWILYHKPSEAVRHSSILSNTLHAYTPVPVLIYGYK